MNNPNYTTNISTDNNNSYTYDNANYTGFDVAITTVGY